MRPCHSCQRSAEHRFDILLRFSGETQLTFYVCTSCLGGARSVGRAPQRRGFTWVGLWLRRDDGGGELADVLDKQEKEARWNEPRFRRAIWNEPPKS